MTTFSEIVETKNETFREIKLTRLQAKPEISYTLIRLLQSELDHVGETGHIFKTEYNGKPLYIISLDEEFDGKINVVKQEFK